MNPDDREPLIYYSGKSSRGAAIPGKVVDQRAKRVAGPEGRRARLRPKAALAVQLIHGLEGSPTGAKAQYLARRFRLTAPSMDTSDFEGSVRTQAAALAEVRPDVVVGSSFGGGVAIALLQRGLYAGPTLLLAPAARYVGVDPRLPDGPRVLIAHGTRDEVIDVEQSRRLAQTGTPGRVRLVEVDDTHRLATLLEGERLADLVREVARAL